jgi:hypothetical protein
LGTGDRSGKVVTQSPTNQPHTADLCVLQHPVPRRHVGRSVDTQRQGSEIGARDFFGSPAFACHFVTVYFGCVSLYLLAVSALTDLGVKLICSRLLLLLVRVNTRWLNGRRIGRNGRDLVVGL